MVMIIDDFLSKSMGIDNIIIFSPINIYAGDSIAHFCKTGFGNQSDIAGSNNGDVHVIKITPYFKTT